jgi:cell division protein FtsB
MRLRVVEEGDDSHAAAGAALASGNRVESALAERPAPSGREARGMKQARASAKLGRLSRAVAAWLTVLAAAGALQVWLHLQTTELGYQLSALHHVLMRLSREKGELEVELATLTSPRALDRAARDRLGMRPPEEGQIVALP